MKRKVKFRYIGGGAFYHGIPARDLTKADWEQLTAEQQALVAGSPLYEAGEQGGRVAGERPGQTIQPGPQPAKAQRRNES